MDKLKACVTFDQKGIIEEDAESVSVGKAWIVGTVAIRDSYNYNITTSITDNNNSGAAHQPETIFIERQFNKISGRFIAVLFIVGIVLLIVGISTAQIKI